MHRVQGRGEEVRLKLLSLLGRVTTIRQIVFYVNASFPLNACLCILPGSRPEDSLRTVLTRFRAKTPFRLHRHQVFTWNRVLRPFKTRPTSFVHGEQRTRPASFVHGEQRTRPASFVQTKRQTSPHQRRTASFVHRERDVSRVRTENVSNQEARHMWLKSMLSLR